jgi:TonB-dependent receptor
MADISLAPRIRMVVGPRVEVASQTINSFDLFKRQDPKQARLDRADVLPAAHLILKTTATSNLRFSVTRTLARPQLRELAPFIFTEFNGARDSYGNPDLDRTQITNLDLRLELFPGANEVLAVTTFFKHFDKPIERTIIQTNIGTDSFANAPSGVNAGLELEGRKGLGFINNALSEFTVMGNLTFVQSRVRLDPSQSFNLTSTERPMAGQSPYVFNTALDWTHEKTKTRFRILYNIFGPRLFAVGQKPIPDIYEQPRNTLDFTAAQGLGDHLDLKFSAENILNAPYIFAHAAQPGQQELVTNQYRMGCNLWLSLTYTN